MATIAPPSGLVPVLYDSQSTESMPANIKAAIDAYLSIVHDYTQSRAFPLTQLEVSSFVLPDEAHHYWIVTHWLDASDDFALAYWEEIDTEIEGKANRLSVEIRTLLAEDISTSVRWKVE